MWAIIVKKHKEPEEKILYTGEEFKSRLRFKKSKELLKEGCDLFLYHYMGGKRIEVDSLSK